MRFEKLKLGSKNEIKSSCDMLCGRTCLKSCQLDKALIQGKQHNFSESILENFFFWKKIQYIDSRRVGKTQSKAYETRIKQS